MEQPMIRSLEVGSVGQDLVRIPHIADAAHRQVADALRAKLNKGIRLQLSVGARFSNRLVMGNVVDDAIYAFDESVRLAGDLIENVRDDAPVEFGCGVRSQDTVLESRVREKDCVLSEHFLAVLRFLERAKRTFEVSTHAPS